MRQNDLKDMLINRLPLLVLIVTSTQPLLDVVSYLTDKWGISNIYTLILRMSVLLLLLFTAFLLSDKKRAYYVTAAVLALCTLCHALACIKQGYDSPIADLTNMIRIYQMPLLVLCFMTFIKLNDKVYKALKYGVCICLIIIAAVEIISVITNTNPYTYENKGIGIIGWFYDSSAQSAILSTAVPIFMTTAIVKFKDKLFLQLLSVAGGCLILYLYATRLAYAALLMTTAGIVITLLISDRKAVKSIILLSLAFVIFLSVLPFSPMQKNQYMVGENAIKKQEKIDNLISEYDAEARKAGLTGQELKVARLEGAYRYYLGGLVERFGLDDTVSRYGYSEKASDICNVRTMKKTYCSMLMDEYGSLARCFGMEISDLTFNQRVYDVENDLDGIYYLTGMLGLSLTILYLGYFIILVVIALIKDFKRIFTIETAGWGIALVACLLHVYATCGVLRRPSSSFYLSVILAVIPYLVSKKKGHENDN